MSATSTNIVIVTRVWVFVPKTSFRSDVIKHVICENLFIFSYIARETLYELYSKALRDYAEGRNSILVDLI